MKKILGIFIGLILVTVTLLSQVALADGTVNWTGNGVSNGQFDNKQCDDSNTAYIYWIFTLGGGTNTVTDATLQLGGSGSGTYTMSANPGNEMKITTPYYDLNTLSASVTYTGNLGNGNANLTISHGCPGSTTPTPTPTTDPCANNACVTPTVTVTPTATPSATPTDTPTPTPTPGNSGCTSNCGSSDNNNNNNSNNNSSNNSSQPTQAVLGASTMASTGTFDTTLMNLMFGSGLMTFGAGLLSLKKNKKA